MGKVSDQITQFTETYSTIVLGMHNDITQYRKEVESYKNKNAAFGDKLHQIVSGAKRIEQSNLQISNIIEGKKSEIETYYKEISGTVTKINELEEDLRSIKSSVERLELKAEQSKQNLALLNSNLEEEKDKNYHLKNDLDKTISNLNTADNVIQNQGLEIDALKRDLLKQAEQIKTQKMLLIACFSLIFFILILTIFL